MKNSELFPREIKTSSDIRERIGIYRTMRRSSDSRAISKGVKEPDIDIVYRWSTKHTTGGKGPSKKLRIGYSDQELVLEECFR